ncbi:hypothetical protein WG947_11815 [Pontibacter sp. H259]|uniref:hypothetical protein n=1 Tax=Pontibacter sp. H259 TaxID=3133421 RepID=UPI0030C5D40D
MKKFTILTIAPALTLLAISCSGPAAMQSGEYDDMYYSTSDKTEYVQPAEPAYAQAEASEQQSETEATDQGAILNPEYSDNNSDITGNYYGDDYEYYDGREYDPRSNWYRPNYSFVDPSWAYDPYPSYRSYSSYDRYYRHRYADPFYDPFYYDPYYYDPFAYRPYYRSGVTISISYHYGWGNYYSRWSPYYYGRYYNPWYPHYNNYYAGYYGHNYVYDYPRYNKPYKVQYGPRGDRGGVVTRDTQREGRIERGTQTEGSEQRAVQGRPERGRTERVSTPATEDRKEVITTRSGGRESYNPRSGEARPGRERVDRPQEQQQQREQPATRPAPERRQTRENSPQREYRSTETRQSQPTRETSRSYEQRETRRSEPTPSRSNSSISGSSTERSGRPPRGN